ncbi:MAG: heme-binding protein [Acidobacteria bacterium]|nr:heme-binding protein [Acidobacteriota bacterium]
MLRDDTTSPHTVDTAKRKAFTSIAFRIPSSEFIRRSETNPGLRQIEGTIALGGGLPIRLVGEVIGAIGVGGAPSGDADAVCAQAGIDKVAGKL